MKFSNYNVYLKRNNFLAIYNTLKSSMIVLPDKNNFCDILLAQCEELDETMRALYDSGCIVDDGIDEYKKYCFFYNLSRTRSGSLSITYVVNFDCDFKCIYCFEGDKKEYKERYKHSKVFDSVSFETVLRNLIEKTSPNFLDFTFFGGEPLLSFELVKCFSDIIKQVCNEKNIQKSVYIVSNGNRITDKDIVCLRDYGIDGFQVTLDGDRDTHDRMRPSCVGESTFERILHNIVSLLENGLSVVLNINYSIVNIEGVCKLLETLPDIIRESAFIKFNRIISTNLNSFACAINDEELDLSLIYRILEQKEYKYYQVSELESKPCIAMLKNSIIYDYIGNVYKCIYSIGDSRYIVGNLFDDERVLDYALLTKPTVESLPDECKVCSVLPICHGGCYFHILRNNLKFGDGCRKEAIINGHVIPFIEHSLRKQEIYHV